MKKRRILKSGATRTPAAASTRGRLKKPAVSARARTWESRASRPAASTPSEVDNRIPVKLSAKRKKELLRAIEPVIYEPAPPEDPSVVIARLRANEPKPAISKKPGGATLDSTYSERRAAWEKAMKRETERKEWLATGVPVDSEENRALAARSEHLVKHLEAGPQPTKKEKGGRDTLPRRMRRA